MEKKYFTAIIIPALSLLLAILELSHLYFYLAFKFPPGSFIRRLFLGFSPLGIIIQTSPIYAPIVAFIAFLRNKRFTQPINKRISLIILIGSLLCFLLFIFHIKMTMALIGD